MAGNFQPTTVHLSRKHRHFLHSYIESGDPGKAALDSGMVRKTTHPTDAAIAGAELLRELQPQLLTLMDAYGLSDRVLLKAILEGISAMVQKAVYHKATKNPDGTESPAWWETVTTEVPDWRTRKFFVRMAGEMKALIDPKDRAAAEQANNTRVSSIQSAHRESLAAKTDEELDAIQREEILRRQGVRRAIS